MEHARLENCDAGFEQPATCCLSESHEDDTNGERRDDAPPPNKVEATRLFDKLSILEQKWNSQKGPTRSTSLRKKKIATSMVQEPQLVNTGTGPKTKPIPAVSHRSVQKITRADTLFANTQSREKTEEKREEAPKNARAVSMFDRLYQNGQTKSITRRKMMHQQLNPPMPKSRTRKRQRAAAIIQGAFRGNRVRNYLNKNAMAAIEIQRWWKSILARAYFLKLTTSVPLVQSLERRRAARQSLLRRKNALLVLQGQWRVYIARRERQQLAAALEKRIRESNASALIQGMLAKHVTVLRQQHVECESLIVEEVPSVDEEDDAMNWIDISADTKVLSSCSQQASAHILSTSGPPEIAQPLLEKAVGSTSLSLSEYKEESRSSSQPPLVESMSVSIYHAAQRRRRAQKHQEISQVSTVAPRSKSCTAPSRKSLAGDLKSTSIVHAYLPSKKHYWHYDSQKLQLVPFLQKWAREQLRMKRCTQAIVKIQSIWRLFRAESLFVSTNLLRQWSVRVDFDQEQTTHNAVLRQKVRLLALSKAIAWVTDKSATGKYVSLAPSAFSVSWETGATIYFDEGPGTREFNHCTIHVSCEALEYRITKSWSSQKKFTLLSKAALFKSFSNQCARLKEASVLLQSLKMKRILVKIAHDMNAANAIQRWWRNRSSCLPAVNQLMVAKHSATLVQSLWRMRLCLNILDLQDMAACTIQAAYLSYQTRVFQRKREAVVTVQTWYRAAALRSCVWKTRDSYKQLRSQKQSEAAWRLIQREQSAVRLQAAWRQTTQRNVFLEKVWAAYVIQAAYRNYEGKKNHERGQMVRIIQAAWLQYQARRKEIAVLRFKSATAIQRFSRGIAARKAFEVMLQTHSAASMIQLAWDRYRDEKAASLYRSIVFLQKTARGFLGRKEALLNRQKLSAALTLQEWWDTMTVKLSIIKAATTIQAQYRVILARRLAQQRAAELHTMRVHAAIQQRLATGYRRYDSLVSDTSMSLRLLGSVSMESYTANKTEFSAVYIQITYRAHLCRLKFLQARAAAVTVQRIWRAYSRRPDNHGVRAIIHEECIEIERTARPSQFVWVKRFRSIAAILVQSWWRMSIQRRTYLHRHTRAEDSPAENLIGRRVAISSILESSPRNNHGGNLHDTEQSREVAISGVIQSADRGSKEAVVPTFLLFNPEVVFSLPRRITNCLVSTKATDSQLADEEKSVLAAIRIQNWWRIQRSVVRTTIAFALSQANSVETCPFSTAHYLHQMRLMIQSVCLLQALWRRTLPRVKSKKESMSTKIASIVRGMQCRRNLQCNHAATVIQRRAQVMFLQHRLRCMKDGFVGLQKEWRKYAAVPEFKARIARRDQGLTIFQRAVTHWFLVKSKAAVTIQQQWRLRRSMVICLQTQWRSFSCRQLYNKQRAGCVLLQIKAKTVFQIKTFTVLALQNQWRMASMKAKYEQKRLCAKYLQTAWRAFSSRSTYKRLVKGFTALQILGKERFATKSTSAVVLQKYHRMTSERADYVTARTGVLGLQVLAKATFQKKLMSIILLQKNWKGHQFRKLYAQKRLGSICIENAFRRLSCQLSYRKMRKGFVSLQLLAKKSYRDKRAVKLQQFARMHLAKTAFSHQRSGAINLQSHWRRYLCHQKFSLQKRGFLALQMKAKKILEVKRISCTLVQRHWRMISTRASYKKSRLASILIQKYSRKNTSRRAFKTMRRGFTTLQGLAKLWFRIKNTCAVKIQAVARQNAGRKRFTKQLQAAVSIQSAFRGFVQRRNYQVLRWLRSIAATMISGWWRRVVDKSQYQSLRRSTTKVQRAFRARRSNHAAIQIQSLYRRCLAHQIAEQRRIDISATIVIQRAWKASQERFVQRCLVVLERVRAAMIIQRWWEKVQLSRHQREEISLGDANKKKSADSSFSGSNFGGLGSQLPKIPPPCDPVSLLCNFDLGLLSAGIVSNSITSLVMPWSNLVTAKSGSKNKINADGESLLRKVQGAVRIQRFWRDYRARKTKDHYYQSIAAAWIQCVWRGYSLRKQLCNRRHQEEKAAAVIQRAWFTFHQPRVEAARCLGAIGIQAAWRKYDQRREFQRHRTAALTIQKAARAVAKKKRKMRRHQKDSWWFNHWAVSSE